MSKNIFVLGATGFQGSPIASQLMSQGNLVITLTRGINNDNLLGGVKSIQGDLSNIPSLKRALKNVDVAIYTFPLIFDMEKAKSFTQNFIDAAESQNVPFVIFNSGFDIPQARTGLLGMDIKYEIQELFDKSELEILTLMPDIYLNNLAAPWSIPLVVEKNILPYPVAEGLKVPWISHYDLGRFVSAAVDKPDLAGQRLPIGGTVLSGDEIAEFISNHLGKEIKFIGLKPDEFEKQLMPAFGELNAKEISNLYRYVEKEQENLSQKPFSKTVELLGIKPSTVQEWIESIDWPVGNNS